MSESQSDPRSAIRRLNLLGLAAVAVLVGGVGGWAATTHLAGAVIASGTVMVESNVKKVQHASGGIVGEILVKEGDVVAAGQVVIRLDDTLTRATLGVVQAQLDLFQAREARLTAERDSTDAIVFPASLRDRQIEPPVASAVGGEEKLFEARRQGRQGQRSQLRERVAQIGDEIRGLTAQHQAKEREIKFIGEELAGVAGLYQRNLVTIVRYMALQRDQARLQGESGQLTAEAARARGKIAETELQILQLDQDFRTEVLKDLRETQGRIAELQERVNVAQDELRRVEIRSPQAGFVHQLAVHTVGGIIGKGDTVLQIVPRAETLIIEAKVAPQDVDQMTVGVAVRIRLAAGNRRTLPDLEGVVIHISPDLTREQQSSPVGPTNQAYYLVRVSLAEQELKRLGDLHLVPGMPAEVYIRTIDRTPLDYLVKPLQEQIARTFRER
jgi:HlyD family secretion protein